MSPDSWADLVLHAFFQRHGLGYCAVASASLLVYDILLGLFEDIRILSTHSPKRPDIVYILSRTFAVCFVAANCIVSTSPQNSCIQQPVVIVVGILGGVLIPCNSWLFLARVRAIPHHFRSQTTLAICTVLWLSTFTSFFTFLAIKYPKATQTEKCELTPIAYTSWLLFAPYSALVVFDTVTMIVIIAGFAAMYSPESSWIARVRSTISMKYMGHLSGVFVRSGMIYYLGTVGIHLSITVLVLLPSDIPSSVLGEIGVLVSIFHNIMTCRVFRLLKLTALDPSGATSCLPTNYPTATE